MQGKNSHLGKHGFGSDALHHADLSVWNRLKNKVKINKIPAFKVKISMFRYVIWMS